MFIIDQMKDQTVRHCWGLSRAFAMAYLNEPDDDTALILAIGA